MAEQAISQPKTSNKLSTTALIGVLGMGIFFGIVLVKSEVVRWERINRMFLFQEAQMYLIIGTAVLVGGVSMWLINRIGVKDMVGEPIAYRPKPMHKGIMIGGAIFGMGWAITGACPGPIYAQIGSGAWLAIFTFVGAIAGTFLYAYLQPKLPH